MCSRILKLLQRVIPDKDLLSDRILHNAGAVFNYLAPAKIVNK
jgi:hypothetical protein